ncbi:MAG: galactose mutarotase [Bacteroidaceae bacterium]|nr:galactose mutarotase [Bacteroidaceae bacterium]
MKEACIQFLALALLLASCASGIKPTVSQQNWGMVDGDSVYLYTLTNSKGLSVKITNYGGIITEFHAPDRNGKTENIVLGLNSLNAYLKGHPALGCIVGRYINRIGNATFTLDGVEYPLAKNSNGRHNIHGGRKNFYTKVWTASASSNAGEATLSLNYLSPDMEEGFPGNLDVKVDYTLTNQNELRIEYAATTDKPTVVNLSNHSYFNLSGAKESVLGHEVRIYADEYIVVDEDLIPTGEMAKVNVTPLDLRAWTKIGDRTELLPNGFDNSFCVEGKRGKAPVLIAELRDPVSGRHLKTYTTQPGVCFYTAKGLNIKQNTVHGTPYQSYWGACLETQHHPDSPNHAHFPSTVLRPGETYHELTIYQIGCD